MPINKRPHCGKAIDADPRLFAPNGRAMVRYCYIRNIGMYGTNDEPHDTGGKWWWWNQTKQIWEATATNPLEGKPCTYDGTPITETKPEPATCKQPLQVDPLARAVTVGELNEKMLRLAAMMDGLPSSSIASVIVKVFQGDEHGQ